MGQGLEHRLRYNINGAGFKGNNGSKGGIYEQSGFWRRKDDVNVIKNVAEGLRHGSWEVAEIRKKKQINLVVRR